ncbi:Fe(2+) transporter [Tilletia horrida]|uniref:Fe(2+) transporter n=1 Tax=Tilletia horrida TaxID=155126 RepID=A0AAN6GR05_9BASI|nr:Fe(2+) transporter [Tilletia horrida]KAK0569731.1 Fe(2+) transporter [Tilletia horrida]
MAAPPTAAHLPPPNNTLAPPKQKLPLQHEAAAAAEDEEEEIDYEGLTGVPIHISMLAGALAGITEHAALYPVDLIRTRMQILSASPSATYNSIAQAFTRISSLEGARALWRGVTSVIVGAGPAHAIHFGMYETVKDLTGGNREGHQFLSTAVAGSAATVAADAFMNPFDVIKQRMQQHGSAYSSVADCARKVYAAEGVRAFYVSYPTTLAMTVPLMGTQFTVYEWAKKVLNPTDRYSPVTHAISGGFAGAVAAAITNPLDVAKTLLQTRGSSQDVQIQKANGLFEAFRIIYAREGMKGFGRGITPRVLTFMPSNALCWLSYEGFRFFLNQRHKPSS